MRVPFISIIIPVYNMEDKIGRCLDSITCQSFDDIEIIVVDDGSTDRTGDVVKKYASVEPRIRYYREENAGVSTARNNGLQASTLIRKSLNAGEIASEPCCFCIKASTPA